MDFFTLFLKIKTFLLSFLFSCAICAQTYQFGLVGDAGTWNTDVKYVHDSLLRYHVTRLVMPGDNIYDGDSYAAIWDRWFADGFNFDITAIGNHTLGYQKEIEYFKSPGEYYSIAYNKFVEFVVLNSDNEGNAAKQAKFLEDVLSSSTSKFIFVVYHHPSYTLSTFHVASEKKQFQKAIIPVLQKYRSKITTLIVGHDHVSLIAHFNDLPVVLSGSTHEQRPHIPLSYKEKSVKIKTNWYNNSSALWARLSLNTASDYAQVDFIRGYDDKSLCTMIVMTGQAGQLTPTCND